MQLKEEELKYLWDIQTCCLKIEKYISGIKKLKEYEENDLVKSAVERQIITISEALVKFNKLSNLEIEHTQKIKAFRNRLVHDYAKIDDSIVWIIATRHINELKKEVRKYLDTEQNKLD
jgi:uncharacterized protein with HEPN domain